MEKGRELRSGAKKSRVARSSKRSSSGNRVWAVWFRFDILYFVSSIAYVVCSAYILSQHRVNIQERCFRVPRQNSATLICSVSGTFTVGLAVFEWSIKTGLHRVKWQTIYWGSFILLILLDTASCALSRRFVVLSPLFLIVFIADSESTTKSILFVPMYFFGTFVIFFLYIRVLMGDYACNEERSLAQMILNTFKASVSCYGLLKQTEFVWFKYHYPRISILAQMHDLVRNALKCHDLQEQSSPVPPKAIAAGDGVLTPRSLGTRAGRYSEEKERSQIGLPWTLVGDGTMRQPMKIHQVSNTSTRNNSYSNSLPSSYRLKSTPPLSVQLDRGRLSSGWN